VARLRLFSYLVFGYLIGNGDLHAKNLSVTQRGGEWAVAPIYDTPASYPYGDTTLGMPLLGESAISDVPRRRWLDLAETVGLPARAAAQVLDDLVAASPRWVDRLDELPFDDRTVAKFRRFLQYRIGLVGPP
jgi:serine/threonine-protein kinase HipA